MHTIWLGALLLLTGCASYDNDFAACIEGSCNPDGPATCLPAGGADMCTIECTEDTECKGLGNDGGFCLSFDGEPSRCYEPCGIADDCFEGNECVTIEEKETNVCVPK